MALLPQCILGLGQPAVKDVQGGFKTIVGTLSQESCEVESVLEMDCKKLQCLMTEQYVISYPNPNQSTSLHLSYISC